MNVKSKVRSGFKDQIETIDKDKLRWLYKQKLTAPERAVMFDEYCRHWRRCVRSGLVTPRDFCADLLIPTFAQ